MLSGLAIDIIAKSGINGDCSAVNAIWVVTRLIIVPIVYNRLGDDFFVFRLLIQTLI